MSLNPGSEAHVIFGTVEAIGLWKPGFLHSPFYIPGMDMRAKTNRQRS